MTISAEWIDPRKVLDAADPRRPGRAFVGALR
jgi:hypothetical protein